MLVSGDIESDEYERQADAMAAVWEALGWSAQRLELPATTTSPWPTSFATLRASLRGRRWRKWGSLSEF